MPVDAVLAAVAIGTKVYGAVKANKAAKAAAANVRPAYTTPQTEYDNQRIAESQAGQGMSAASKQDYLNNAGQGLAATNDAILRGGGDANSLSATYDKYNQGISDLSIYDDQARQGHLNNLIAQNQRMSADKDKEYQLNQLAPWADKAKLYAAQQQAGQQIEGQGIGMFTKAATGAAGYFNTPDDPAEKTTATPPAGVAPSSNMGSYYGTPDYQPQAPYYSPNTPSSGDGSGTYGWNGYMPMYQ